LAVREVSMDGISHEGGKTVKVLIVGQGPGKNHNGDKALAGSNRGSGVNLAKLCGISHEELLQRCTTVNLLSRWYGSNGKGDQFPLKLAKRKAVKMWIEFFEHDNILLLGNNVAKAFETKASILEWIPLHGGMRFAIIPHPSGINRWYNSANNRKRAKIFLRELFRKETQ
jgi:uracil-DNA glycosylase